MFTSHALRPDPDPARAAAPAAAPIEDADEVRIETRFGELWFKRENAIAMPSGLPGFGGYREFALAHLPDLKLGDFVLFQCLTEPELAFLVLPLALDNPLIKPADVEEALQTTQVPREDAALLLIVTRRAEPEGIQTSANLRAPIVIDTRRKLARQYVMPNGDYAIRHAL